jgi:hypothetical protein
MTGKERRDKMDLAIKGITIPFLRQQGFKGSYLHFRSEQNDVLNLLTFQFSLYGSQFDVEISNCPTEGFTNSYGKFIKPSGCSVHYLGNRLRVGSIKNKTDYWYSFNKESLFGNIYKNKAKEIIANWEGAEKWWTNNPFEGYIKEE